MAHAMSPFKMILIGLVQCFSTRANLYPSSAKELRTFELMSVGYTAIVACVSLFLLVVDFVSLVGLLLLFLLED